MSVLSSELCLYGKLIINEFGNGYVNDNNLNISIYINKKDLNCAFNNEIVEVQYYKKNDLYYGKVVNYSLLNKIFIGYVHHFYLDEIYIYCSELKKNNLISIKTNLNLYKNNWVIVKVVSNNNNKLFGELLEILQNNIDTIIEKKFKLFNIEQNDVKTHIEQFDLDTFTIDPESTQDCDDAFSIKYIDENNIKIYIHISDVAHWINPTNPLFDEIIKRGNTFYGKNTNWTMIPRNYSDNLCSILPNKKTYVVTHEFTYNKKNCILDYNKWYYSIIESKNKYNYDYVDDNFNDMRFKIIYDTSMIIKKDIPDFNLVNETKSHIMVKYWMIKINQIMSNIIQKIYRSNLKPNDIKFDLLQNYFQHKELNIDINNRTDIIKYIDENPSKFHYYMIKNLLTKAYYYSTDKSHYGLGIDNYTHWTSPIRRACDLLNHCILKGYDIDIVPYLEYMNEMELKQDLIEEFIINFNNYKNINIGTIFEGIIIKINNNCIVIYIKDLDNKFSLHISKLCKEKLIYDENNKILINENYKILYKLFDKINIKVTKIDFEILDFEI